MQLPRNVCLSETNLRDDNQDSFLVIEFTPFGANTPLLVLAVSDGLGGYGHGAEVSREVLRQMSLSLFQQLAIEPGLNNQSRIHTFGLTHLAAALQEAAKLTNNYVNRLVEINEWRKAGATLVLACVFEAEAVVLNLGDSPLFHYKRATSTLQRLTEDHTVAGALLRDGVITPEMARYHEGNSQLEFYLGSRDLPVRLPVRYQKLEEGDLLLLCSDGISRLVSLDQMSTVLQQMETALDTTNGLANFAEALREEALSAGEADNQTIIVWRYCSAATNPD